MNNIDSPLINDNRFYNFSGENFYIRSEFSIISSQIKNGSRVVDLGCGNGSLMKYLKDKKNVNIEGVEITSSGVDFCLKNGLIAKQGEIDKKETYASYKDQEFDYAICNVTVQMVMFPEILLSEMKRISKYQIISFPNFAYFENRLDLLFNGVMPRKMLYGYSWYSTGHIHQLSIKDFKRFCLQNNLKILKDYHLGFFGGLAKIFWSNLFSKIAIYVCQKK